MIERLAWFWTDWMRRGPARRRWLAPAVVFVSIQASAAAIAWWFGEFSAWLGDPRWTASALISTACAVHLDMLPRDLDRLWDSLHPWVAVPEEEFARLRALTRPMLANAFPFSVLVWASFVTVWIVTNSWSEAFRGLPVAWVLNALYGYAFLCYFLGVAVSFNVGLWRLLRQVAARLEFHPSLVLSGDSGSLKPINQLLGRAWLFFLVVVVLTGVGTTPISRGDARIQDLIIWLIVALVLCLRLSSQRSMNRLIARDKARVLGRLRGELDLERQGSDEASGDVVRRLHRLQILLHDIRTAERFSATLVDTRFVVQIALSVSATLIANVMVRTLLDRVMSR